MKKLIMAVICVLGTLTANAQAEPGTLTLMPKVGLNLANLSDMKDYGMKAGAIAGVEAEYQFTNLISASVGLHYSMQGSKWSEGGSSDKFLMDYINIPILANFYVYKGLALKVGIQPGFLVSSKFKWDYEDEGEGDVDFKDACKSFDFSIPVGISYEYQSFVLDVRYNIGVTKVWDLEDAKDSKNGVLAITLGYKFAL